MSLNQLLDVIRKYPLIDNHAHNLLLPSESQNEDFLSITSEAQGDALADTRTSLSHLRAAKQLRELYGCKQNADWDTILAERKKWTENRLDDLMTACFEGTCAILMDDGLGGIKGAERVHPYDWHDQFTEQPTKRIVRIETVAEECLANLCKKDRFRKANYGEGNEEANLSIWMTYEATFTKSICMALTDPQVVGFKSVVCYRTGLDIDVKAIDPSKKSDLVAAFANFVTQVMEPFGPKATNEDYEALNPRIESKIVNDWLVCKTFELISSKGSYPDKSDFVKPVQFHTGLGDKDIDLRTSSPVHLRPLFEAYPETPVVLLHASYPYTREAGYLAAVYPKVYLDIGEVFPQLSYDGQFAVLKQSLELAPWGKLLWSTDGHHFPETYHLANRQFRSLLEEVIPEFVAKEWITYTEGVELVKSILFTNANKLYQLGLTLPVEPSRSEVGSHAVSEQGISVQYKRARSWFHKEEVKYVCVQYMDFLGTLRTRILPTASFLKLLSNGSRVGISRGNTGTLQDDSLTPVANPVGQIYLQPDLDSLYRPRPGQTLNAASVLCFWQTEAGGALSLCPRIGLAEDCNSPLSLVQELKDSYQIDLLVGFEIEVTFLYASSGEGRRYEQPLTTNHQWGSLSSEDQEKAIPMLTQIVEVLARIGIEVEQFHSEAGNGQYEFVLPPKPPLASIDSLVRARCVIQEIAHNFGLRATYHPMPLSGIGTAAHAHISLNTASGAVPVSTEFQFWGGVLKHLPSICAFTLPEEPSYKRVVEDSWTGGIYVAWGEQNRETPLRRVCPGRWEVRCLDGFANMYLAIRVIIAAGLLGLAEEGLSIMAPCTQNPSKISEEERDRCGLRPMPRDIHSALKTLEKDDQLKDKMGRELTEHYLVMKRAEQEKLVGMGADRSRIWLIERY